MTERGDIVNTRRPGNFNDGLPSLKLDGLPVYRYCGIAHFLLRLHLG